jgi:hypothetical protein
MNKKTAYALVFSFMFCVLCTEVLAEQYSIIFNGIRIDNTRSRSSDTNYASLSLQVGSRKFETKTKFLDDQKEGIHPVGLSYDGIDIPRDATPVKIVWAVINNGHGNQGTIQSALSAGSEALLQQNSSGNQQLDNFVLVLIKVGLGWLFANCDGPVIAGVYSATGADIAAETASNEKSISTDYPGIDSPAGCGSNSRYNSHIRIIKR